MKQFHTFEDFLNEAFRTESEAYNEVVNILKTLHSFSNRIKFRVENVNGSENIVYDDEKMITRDCLNRLKDRRFWNTGFDATTGIFGNKRVNINFHKSVQDGLNIKEFDKKDWSPKGFKN